MGPKTFVLVKIFLSETLRNKPKLNTQCYNYTQTMILTCMFLIVPTWRETVLKGQRLREVWVTFKIFL